MFCGLATAACRNGPGEDEFHRASDRVDKDIPSAMPQNRHAETSCRAMHFLDVLLAVLLQKRQLG